MLNKEKSQMSAHHVFVTAAQEAAGGVAEERPNMDQKKESFLCHRGGEVLLSFYKQLWFVTSCLVRRQK